MLDGNAFAVSISLGGEVEEVGEVSWPEDVTARDLVITRYDGIVTLETGAGDNAQPNGLPSGGGSGDGTTGTPSTGPGIGETARAPAVSFAAGADPPGQCKTMPHCM